MVSDFYVYVCMYINTWSQIPTCTYYLIHGLRTLCVFKMWSQILGSKLSLALTSLQIRHTEFSIMCRSSIMCVYTCAISFLRQCIMDPRLALNLLCTWQWPWFPSPCRDYRCVPSCRGWHLGLCAHRKALYQWRHIWAPNFLAKKKMANG